MTVPGGLEAQPCTLLLFKGWRRGSNISISIFQENRHGIHEDIYRYKSPVGENWRREPRRGRPGKIKEEKASLAAAAAVAKCSIHNVIRAQT
jgi:hypothetical protein